MTILLWVRTTRHVDTLGPEIDALRHTLLAYSHQPYDWLEPFLSGDHVLFGIRTDAQIHGLRAFLVPEMKQDFIVDWSLTEVGRGLGPCEAYIGEKADGAEYFDDRFIDPQDEEFDDEVKAADELNFSVLNWALPYDVRGATALWLAFDRDRSDFEHFLRQVERALPRPYQRMWQGRSAVLYTYQSEHSFRAAAPWGVGPELDKLLADDRIAYFLAFQVGNWSIGGAIEIMNPMADWIWKRRPKKAQRRLPSKPQIAIISRSHQPARPR